MSGRDCANYMNRPKNFSPGSEVIQAAIHMPVVAELFADECGELGLDITPRGGGALIFWFAGPRGEELRVEFNVNARPPIEQLLQQLDFRFESLPLLIRGESKEIRLLTPHITVAKLIPSVYSHTHNRYGIAPGTDEIRARFSAKIFRRLVDNPGPRHISTAFLGLIESSVGPLLAERRVETCNLEIRVKRYHIGSPLHRYRFTEKYATTQRCGPISRWSRFDSPLVCFDWRHPLVDKDGNQLADEPISDDYASIWMENIPNAKRLAREMFEWMEDLFASRSLRLVDICFFVDRSGSTLFGEISPDCMRVRTRASDDAMALDKDEWRSGGSPSQVLQKYKQLYGFVFQEKEERS